MTAARRDSFSLPHDVRWPDSSSGDRRHARWPDSSSGEPRRARWPDSSSYPPRRTRWSGWLALAVLVLCAATAVGVVTLRPRWVPHPAQAALARVRGSVLAFLGRRIERPAPTRTWVAAPPPVVSPEVAPPARTGAVATPSSVANVPIFLVSSLPVAHADWRDPSKATVRPKAASHGPAPVRTRHAQHAAGLHHAPVATGSTPDEVTPPPASNTAPEPLPIAAAAGPAPAPGSLDDLIRKSVLADAKKGH
jgi:hypothetical protein